MARTARQTPSDPSRRATNQPPRDHWLTRLLGRGEDPLQWSLPLFRLVGVQLRLHLILVAWAAAELLISARPDVQGPLHRFAVVLSMVTVVLLRESLRILFLWGRGWLPERVVMWQAGSLSSPLGLAPRMLAPTSGLVIGFLLVAASGTALLAMRIPRELLFFNPLDPSAAVSSLRSVSQVIAFWAYYSSLVVCGLNLLPMLPMDMGRLLQCTIARQAGQRAGLKAAAHFGLAAALTISIFGVVSEQMRLTGVAMVGAAVAWIELRRLAFIEDATMNPSLDLVEWIESQPGDDLVMPPSAPEADPGPEAQLPSLDDVLERIGRSGLESLTKIERMVLSRETDRLRERRGK